MGREQASNHNFHPLPGFVDTGLRKHWSRFHETQGGSAIPRVTDSTPLFEKVYLTKAELARYTGHSQRFCDMHLRPFLSVYRLNPLSGTKVLFLREEVDRLIESRKAEVPLEVRL